MRNYKYDNLRFVMIFFVVFGHCLELISGNLSKNLYIIIYTFHIPVFVFITGFFAKRSKEKIIKFIKIYLIWQTIYCLFDRYFLNIGTILQYYMPNRFMWYIMAMIAWFLLLKIFETDNEKAAIMLLVFSFVLSIVSGFLNEMGYILSVSRIVTFFPYFILGYYSKKFNWKFNISKIKKNNLIIWTIIFVVSISYFLLIKDTIDPIWLYGSYSYENGSYTFIFKIMWILLSLCELFIFINIIPEKKIKIISQVGANTLWTYLLHGLIMKTFEFKILFFRFSENINIVLALITTNIILIMFGILLPKLLSKINFKSKTKLESAKS